MFLCGPKDTRTRPRRSGRIDSVIAGIFAGNLYNKNLPRINVGDKKDKNMEENKKTVGRTFWDCLNESPFITGIVLAIVLDAANTALKTVMGSRDKKSWHPTQTKILTKKRTNIMKKFILSTLAVVLFVIIMLYELPKFLVAISMALLIWAFRKELILALTELAK